jgi:hypothetical protein
MARTKNTSIALVEEAEAAARGGGGIARKSKREIEVETHRSFEDKYRNYIVGHIDALKARRAEPKSGFKIG